MSDTDIIQDSDFEDFLDEGWHLNNARQKAEVLYGDLYDAVEEYKEQRGISNEE